MQSGLDCKVFGGTRCLGLQDVWDYKMFGIAIGVLECQVCVDGMMFGFARRSDCKVCGNAMFLGLQDVLDFQVDGIAACSGL